MRNPRDQHNDYESDAGYAGSGSGGRASRFFSRVFENPDNPLGWSIRIFTFSGIAVRVHIFTLLFIGFMLLWSIPSGHAGVGFMALAMISLTILVMLHEFGHCFACRWVGGSADRIVMLPIGGLALIRPPHHWKAHLISTIGGPGVNAVILPFTVLLLMLTGLSDHIIFNPFAPIGVVSDPAFGASSTIAAWGKIALWWVHYINLLILLFNILIPAYPMDGGRILQAALWSKLGYHRATEITVIVGLFAAMVMVVLGLAANEAMLAVIGGVAIWACWTERRRIRGEIELGADVDFAMGSALDADTDLEDPWTQRKLEKAQQAAAKEQAELDRVLAKIAATGMTSLTRAERRTLKTATDRKRKAESDPPSRRKPTS